MKKNLEKLTKQVSKSMTDLSKSLTDLPKKITGKAKPRNYVQESSSDLGRLGASFDNRSTASTSSLLSISTTGSQQHSAGAVGSPSGSRQASEIGGPTRPLSSSSVMSNLAFAPNPNRAEVAAAQEREAILPHRTNTKDLGRMLGVSDAAPSSAKGKASAEPATAATRPSSPASFASSDSGRVAGFQLDTTRAQTPRVPVNMPPLPPDARGPSRSTPLLVRNIVGIENERPRSKRRENSTHKGQATTGPSAKKDKDRRGPSV